jgi:hypothetical protein
MDKKVSSNDSETSRDIYGKEKEQKNQEMKLHLKTCLQNAARSMVNIMLQLYRMCHGKRTFFKWMLRNRTSVSRDALCTLARVISCQPALSRTHHGPGG